jgi:beta-glucosidase
VTADPRLLARYDGDGGSWHIAGGTYRVGLATAANAVKIAAEVRLEERRFGR